MLEIADEFPVSRPAISKHLRILKEAGLVIETPDGRQRFYTLEGGPLERLREWLDGLNGKSALRRPRAGWVGAAAETARRPRVARLRGAHGDWRVW